MSIYTELADYIDQIYENSYREPHDESRAFVKIFRRLLSEEDVKAAMSLDDHEISVMEFASKTGFSQVKAEKIMNRLVKKGISFATYKSGGTFYQLAPFCSGILDFLLNDGLDAEIAQYIQDYVDEINEFIHRPERKKSAGRSVPINVSVTADPYHASFAEVLSYIEKGSIYSVSDCLCRSAKEKLGQSCGHTIKDICIQIGPYAEFYIRTGRGRPISRKEVIEVLKKSEAEGLFHEIVKPQNNESSYFVCNCCTCCCISVRTVIPGIVSHIESTSVYIAQVDADKCTGCYGCIDNCPVSAIDMETSSIAINPVRCIGCGMCTFFCTNQALSIIKKR